MERTRAETLFSLAAVDVAACHLQPASSRGKQDSVQAVQTSHRLDILYAWLTGRDPSSTSPISDNDIGAEVLSGDVMDLGCGQGDQTGATAALFASNPAKYAKADKQPTVTGVDPASPDYGSPFTLQQAQDFLSAQPAYSKHLSFVLGQAAPEVLKRKTFDTVVLSHSLWYFPSIAVLRDTFKAIKEAGVKHLLLAEWAMTASHPNALPHLLSVLLQGQSPVEGGNVQLAISPEQIKAIAEDAGWKVDRELIFLPNEKLQDGKWEIDMARDAADEAAKLDCRGDKTREKLQRSVRSTRYALEEAVDRIGKQTRCMDVWTAVLSPI